jgi:DNA-binding response OmpR family regulator
MKASSESIAEDSGVGPACASVKTTKRILLAWDDALARRLLAQKLSAAGFEVDEAGDSTTALNKLHGSLPHAVFLQFSLQGSKGIEFVKEARSDTRFADRPIYVCTVCASMSTLTRRTANAGPTKFFNMLATPVETILANVLWDVTDGQAGRTDDDPEAARWVAPVERNVPPEIKRKAADLTRDLEVIVALSDREVRVARCSELRRAVNQLMICGAAAGLLELARLAASVENLLKTMCASPENITEPSLQSIGGAFHTLNSLCGARGFEPGAAVLTAVVLADEAPSRAAACNALIGAGFETNSFSDHPLLLKHLAVSRADLLVLGWHTAEAKACDVYASVRALPMQETTPIVVIGNPGPEMNPESFPGADVMLQPFSHAELAVRSLTMVYNVRLSQPHPGPDTNAAFDSDPVVQTGNTAEPPDSIKPPVPPQRAASSKDIVMNSSQETLAESAPNMVEPAKPRGTDPVARCKQLEEELSGMGNLCGELLAKYTAEQQTAAEAAQRSGELQGQLEEKESELTRLNAELAELLARTHQLDPENQSLQQPKSAVEGQAANPQAEAGPSNAEMAEVQQRLEEASTARARLSADLERERAERRRLEQRTASLTAQLQEMHARTGQQLEAERLSQERISTLEQQLRDREDALARAVADAEKEAAGSRSADEQLKVASDLIARLQNSVASFDGARKAMQKRHDELEKQLQASLNAAVENESRAEKEAREKERLEKALASADRAAQQQATEISRLQCALEVEQAEKQRLEGEAVHLRYSTADSARAGVTAINRLRSETRGPVNNLMQATRRLLEAELSDDAKNLVTSVLDNALLLQDKLQEIGAAKPAAASTAASAAPAAPAEPVNPASGAPPAPSPAG